MGAPLIAYGLLAVAITAETFATSCLNASQQLSRLWPTLGSIAGYCVSFTCLSQVLRYLPVGIAYAIWCALGIILVTLMGYLWFGQKMDVPALVGMGLIIAGVLVIQLFSRTAHHT